MTNTEFIIQSVIKLLAAVACGLILGFERRSHYQVIGIRTLTLICVSSTLLSILSSYMATNELFAPIGRGDPTRIAAGVISGIGFLGGGAIMKQGLNIKGLTSAAIIWTSASLGLALGAGLYIQCAVVVLIVMTVLLVVEKIQDKIFPAGRSKTLHLCFEEDKIDMNALKEIIQKHKFYVSDVNISRVLSANTIILHYSVKAPRNEDFAQLIEDLKQIGKLSEFSITD